MFSLSITVRWGDEQNIDDMGTLGDEFVGRLNSRDAEKQRREEIKLRRDRVRQDKGSLFWRELMISAKDVVSSVKKQRQDLSDLEYRELNVLSFQVNNRVYPSVLLQVDFTGERIEIRYLKTENAHSGENEHRSCIELQVDDSDNLVLRHSDSHLLSKEAVLRLLIEPVIHLK